MTSKWLGMLFSPMNRNLMQIYLRQTAPQSKTISKAKPSRGTANLQHQSLKLDLIKRNAELLDEITQRKTLNTMAWSNHQLKRKLTQCKRSRPSSRCFRTVSAQSSLSKKISTPEQFHAINQDNKNICGSSGRGLSNFNTGILMRPMPGGNVQVRGQSNWQKPVYPSIFHSTSNNMQIVKSTINRGTSGCAQQCLHVNAQDASPGKFDTERKYKGWSSAIQTFPWNVVQTSNRKLSNSKSTSSFRAEDLAPNYFLRPERHCSENTLVKRQPYGMTSACAFPTPKIIQDEMTTTDINLKKLIERKLSEPDQKAFSSVLCPDDIKPKESQIPKFFSRAPLQPLKEFVIKCKKLPLPMMGTEEPKLIWHKKDQFKELLKSAAHSGQSQSRFTSTNSTANICLTKKVSNKVNYCPEDDKPQPTYMSFCEIAKRRQLFEYIPKEKPKMTITYPMYFLNKIDGKDNRSMKAIQKVEPLKNAVCIQSSHSDINPQPRKNIDQVTGFLPQSAQSSDAELIVKGQFKTSSGSQGAHTLFSQKPLKKKPNVSSNVKKPSLARGERLFKGNLSKWGLKSYLMSQVDTPKVELKVEPLPATLKVVGNTSDTNAEHFKTDVKENTVVSCQDCGLFHGTDKDKFSNMDWMRIADGPSLHPIVTKNTKFKRAFSTTTKQNHTTFPTKTDELLHVCRYCGMVHTDAGNNCPMSEAANLFAPRKKSNVPFTVIKPIMMNKVNRKNKVNTPVRNVKDKISIIKFQRKMDTSKTALACVSSKKSQIDNKKEALERILNSKKVEHVSKFTNNQTSINQQHINSDKGKTDLVGKCLTLKHKTNQKNFVRDICDDSTPHSAISNSPQEHALSRTLWSLSSADVKKLPCNFSTGASCCFNTFATRGHSHRIMDHSDKVNDDCNSRYEGSKMSEKWQRFLTQADKIRSNPMMHKACTAFVPGKGYLKKIEAGGGIREQRMSLCLENLHHKVNKTKTKYILQGQSDTVLKKNIPLTRKANSELILQHNDSTIGKREETSKHSRGKLQYIFNQDGDIQSKNRSNSLSARTFSTNKLKCQMPFISRANNRINSTEKCAVTPGKRNFTQHSSKKGKVLPMVRKEAVLTTQNEVPPSFPGFGDSKKSEYCRKLCSKEENLKDAKIGLLQVRLKKNTTKAAVQNKKMEFYKYYCCDAHRTVVPITCCGLSPKSCPELEQEEFPYEPKKLKDPPKSSGYGGSGCGPTTIFTGTPANDQKLITICGELKEMEKPCILKKSPIQKVCDTSIAATKTVGPDLPTDDHPVTSQNQDLWHRILQISNRNPKVQKNTIDKISTTSKNTEDVENIFKARKTISNERESGLHKAVKTLLLKNSHKYECEGKGSGNSVPVSKSSKYLQYYDDKALEKFESLSKHAEHMNENYETHPLHQKSVRRSKSYSDKIELEEEQNSIVRNADRCKVVTSSDMETAKVLAKSRPKSIQLDYPEGYTKTAK